MKSPLIPGLCAALLVSAVTASASVWAQEATKQPAAAMAAPGQGNGRLDAVLAGGWRLPANRARDVYRHPKATLRFFGIRPNQTVIEINPAAGWYSEILAPLLHDEGHYIAAEPRPSGGGEAGRDDRTLRAKFAADPAEYGKAAIVEYDSRAPVFGAPGSADAVLTFRNVHNWAMAGTAPAMFKAFFAVLRPGGVLGVVDHRAAPGAVLDAVKSSGYLPTAYVVKLATEAGFRLEAGSEINANPKDDRDHPKGVWTLPPTLALGATDRAKYLAIGESDRMTLRFVKPVVPPAAATAR